MNLKTVTKEEFEAKKNSATSPRDLLISALRAFKSFFLQIEPMDKSNYILCFQSKCNSDSPKMNIRFEPFKKYETQSFA
jgi:hypothetical protein